ncbi:hypothetical protein DSM106972_025320 [Dulcicalothrix desertica PCC 7102]|uniref:Uncharacterized protein n=2 Tax=Dulcicalothrix desertica TaxID=32056 RepID=A0A433VMG4_9CYAN|nr:hypothetical protein [Dulcicalothrix desertica]RUT07271.1 hypothetical protein DSM106972_025320 [Dulcicalothrix desertica PCC 7102]TWH55526.1 hypothetical protein CAL7102_03670 [Dulcicalothrix desertica PCC 7102]
MVRRGYREPNPFNPSGNIFPKLPNPPPLPGNPVTRFEFNQTEELFDDIVSASVDVKEDKCNIIVNVSAYSSMHAYSPQLTYIYRKPECDLPPPKQPLPIYEYETPAFVPLSCDVFGVMLIFTKYYLSYEDGVGHRFSGGINCLARDERKITLLKFDYSLFEKGLEPLGTIDIDGNDIEYYYYVEIYIDLLYRRNTEWMTSFRIGSAGDYERLGDIHKANGWDVSDDWQNKPNAIWTYEAKVTRKCYYGSLGRLIAFFDDNFKIGVDNYVPFIKIIGQGESDTIRRDNKNYQRVNKDTTSTYTRVEPLNSEQMKILSEYGDRSLKLTDKGSDIYGNYFIYEGSYLRIDALETSFECKPFNMPDADRPPYKYQPPPPPPMTCNCCPNIQNNDALLRLILKRIGIPEPVVIFDEDMDRSGDQKATKLPMTLFEGSKLNVERTEITNRLIGIENYPIKAPRSIIEDYKTIFPQDIVSLFEFAYENPEIELKSLTEFLNWQVEQESATMGQWYQLIEYETKDKDGQIKKERVELVNVAETLKEIIILLGGVNKNLTFLDDLLIRNITETIGAKTNAIRAAYIAEDIQDYLDYPTTEKSVSVPISVSLPDKNLSLAENEDLKRFLKMSVGKITYQDWSGKQSLHDLLLDLLQAASTIRGAMSESGEELAHYFQFEDGVSIDE